MVSGSMGGVTISSMRPPVACFTQSLMVTTADGSSKSRPWTLAPKLFCTASRKGVSMRKDSRWKTALAMSSRTFGSRPSRRSRRSRYAAFMSSRGMEPKPSVARIWSRVVPAAPFMVMPSAMDADSGDRKTVESGIAWCTWRRRSTAKLLLAWTSAASVVERARGSPAMGSDGPVGSPPPHPAARRTVAKRRLAPGRERRRRILGIMGSRDVGDVPLLQGTTEAGGP